MASPIQETVMFVSPLSSRRSLLCTAAANAFPFPAAGAKLAIFIALPPIFIESDEKSPEDALFCP